MARKVLRAVGEQRLVALGSGTQRARVVGDDQLGPHALIGDGPGEGATGCHHGRDEDLRTRAAGPGQRGAYVIDEQLLAGAPLLAHGAFEALGKGLVSFTAQALDKTQRTGELTEIDRDAQDEISDS